jgi:serine/threonine protein phosphatase PrpC
MPHGYQYVRAFASNREKSDDAAGIFECGDSIVVALADGAGGIRGGATASRAFVEAVKVAANDPTFSIDDADGWIDLFRETDKALHELRAGETTGVVVSLSARTLLGVGTGDSEAWMVTPTRVDDLTAMQHTKRRLGSGRVVPAVFHRGALSGALLVATDGLLKHAAMEVIARIVRASPIGVAAEQLIDLVRLPSGRFPDDVGIVLVGQTESARLP